MSYLTSTICVLIIIYNRIHNRSMSDPSTIFAVLWLVVCLLSSLQLFGLKQPGDIVFYIIISGVIAFYCGSLIGSKIVLNKRYVFSGKDERFLSFRLLYTFITVFYFIMIIPTFRAMSFLLSGVSLYSIRYNLLHDVFGDGLLLILFNYFCEPFLVFLIAYSVANIFSNSRHYLISILTILGIILVTITTGGRFFIMYYICALVISYFLYRSSIHSRITSKTLNRIRLLIIIGFISIVIVSNVRDSTIGRTMYIYLTGGINYLDHLLIQFSDVDYTFGSLTLNGYLRPIFVIFRKLGIGELPSFISNAENIFLLVDEPFYIAPGVLFNSFTTCFFAPYIDGGFLGVIITFGLLGYCSERSYKQINIGYSYSITLYLLFALIVVLSFFRLLLTHYSYALSFVYLIICFRKKLEVINNE